ncbi:MAG: DUF2975 domain-containing protein [Clostridia bacterium]|nr:DUF2975 domain-containing protein [Clostridia bacterium]
MKRFSLILSYVFCVLGFFAVIALCIILPISDMQMIASAANARQWFVFNCILSYLILALVLFADVFLFILLQNVRNDRIFTTQSGTLLRLISWASIFAGLLAFPLTFTFLYSALFVSFVGLFLGFVVRVVGQVIRRGTELKEENDATI